MHFDSYLNRRAPCWGSLPPGPFQSHESKNIKDFKELASLDSLKHGSYCNIQSRIEAKRNGKADLLNSAKIAKSLEWVVVILPLRLEVHAR